MSREIILGVHGLGGRGAWFKRLADRLEASGVQFETLDLTGFGTNNSDEDSGIKIPKGHVDSYLDWIREVQSFYQDLKSRYPKARINIMGHSLGGLIVTNLIEIFPGDRLILSAPAFASSKETFNPFFLIKAYTQILKDFFSQSLSYIELPLSKKDFDPSDRDPLKVRFVTVKLLQEIQKMTKQTHKNLQKIQAPTLVLKVKHDQVISNAAIDECFKQIASFHKQLIVIDGDDHDWIWYDTVDLGAKVILEWLRA
jgi:alpha-beta hydrolase superfamily lysophospholipase